MTPAARAVAGECSTGAYAAGALRTGTAPEPVVTTARVLLDSTLTCDAATALGSGQVPAGEELGLPDGT